LLKQRIITALIAAPLVVAAIFFLPVNFVAVVFGVLAGLGLYEWGRLAGLATVRATTVYLAIGAIVAACLWFVPQLWQPLLMLDALLWCLALVVVMKFPASGRWLEGHVLLVAGYVVVISAWLALIVIRESPVAAWGLVWAFVLVWGADIGAYFAGRALGRIKLAPAVSPGKTWEGVAGGMLLALVVCVALAVSLPALTGLEVPVSTWLVVIAVLVAVSVLGDLFESALKRHHGVKDSGSLFPGHGGVLDRIDSLLAVLPFGALVTALV